MPRDDEDDEDEAIDDVEQLNTQGYVSITLRLAEKMLLFFFLFTDSQSSGLSSNPLFCFIAGEQGKSPDTCRV